MPTQSWPRRWINSIGFRRKSKSPKYTATEVVNSMQSEGFGKFKIRDHTDFWKTKDGKNPSKGVGFELGGRWFWYDSWVNEVRNHCNSNRDKFHVGLAA